MTLLRHPLFRDTVLFALSYGVIVVAVIFG